MKRNIFSITIVLMVLMLVNACSKSFANEDGLYATIITNHGEFTAKLYYDKAPVTVGNFVGLAEGKIEFTDPVTNQKAMRPYFNGILFHRIIAGFMIQTGDPLGKGYGGPGYSFMDEFSPDLKHDSEGVLSMANSGPGTNGSQFFVTLVPTAHLDNKHTVFGKVVDGIDIVKKIGVVDTDSSDRPYKDVFIKKIVITRVGSDASKFDAVASFEARLELAKKQEEERNKQMEKFLITLGCTAENKTVEPSGLQYYTIKNGTGRTPAKGNKISVHYTGYLPDGSTFDSSRERKTPFELSIGIGQVIKGWDEGVITMKEGERRILVIPYYLGYGERGQGPIPPKATLIFDTELLKIIK